MKKLLVLVFILIIAIGAIVFGLGRKQASAPTSQTGQTEETSKVQPTATNDTAQAAATITYSNDGFSPAEITVKSGDTVEIKNTSNRPVDFDSDPHPAHTDDVDLNAGLIKPGGSKKFVLTNKGTWGYHNHLNATETGKVNVQ